MSVNPTVGHTTPGIGPSFWRSTAYGDTPKPTPVSVVYRLYTETRDNLVELVSRYFDGATLLHGIGIWQGNHEDATIVEVIATSADLQRIVNLAGDIKHVNAQSSVLVTWSNVSRLDV